MRSIKKIITSDRELNQIQESIIRGLDPIIQNPLSDVIILNKVELVSGENTIPHQLGRKLLGWFLVRNRSNVTVYDTQDSNLLPARNLTLVASGASTVDIAVF